MNNVSTANILDYHLEFQVTTTGVQHEKPASQPESILRNFELRELPNSIFFVTISSITSIVDYWLNERTKRNAVVTFPIYQENIGRPISRSQALRIIDRILEQAEQRRQDYLIFEATRGVQWEDS